MKNYSSFPYRDIIKNYKSSGDSFYDIGFKYAGPILFIYVWWVLLEAQKKNINRLYFIARDGYPLYEIAKIFVDKFNLNIECKYLYCSRKALILPSINKSIEDELFNITKYSAKSTINIILDRIDASEEQKINIINDLVITNKVNIDRNKILTIDEHKIVQNALMLSKIYIDTLKTNANTNYKATVSYLKQEGLYDHNAVHIVDIGWAGSIQKYLSKIINMEKPNIKIFAYYFGTLYSLYLRDNGELYDTWYFGKNKQNIARALFSINIMESICTAPHGTTKSYHNNNNVVIPFLDNLDTKKTQITNQINSGILAFTRKMIMFTNFSDFKKSALHRYSFGICYKLMCAPSMEIVDCFSEFVHCDDITNSYFVPLIEDEDLQKLHYYNIPTWLYHKITRKQYKDDYKALMWPYGVIAKLPFLKRWWYRVNIFLIYYVRYRKLISN